MSLSIYNLELIGFQIPLIENVFNLSTSGHFFIDAVLLKFLTTHNVYPYKTGMFYLIAQQVGPCSI